MQMLTCLGVLLLSMFFLWQPVHRIAELQFRTHEAWNTNFV